MTPEQIAEAQRPGWRVVSEANQDQDAGFVSAKPDVVTPEIGVLMKKYFGEEVADTTDLTASDAGHATQSSFVTMEPRKTSDPRFGRKTVLVENGEITGEQG